ncbi:MAG: class I SAM-dependent methyltransferase [Deltaproteobacteria bacterium]|nr:class I SAM-dependent methyltransferase [Deltaproteobacteria bacterium]MBI4374670.1 class I SAM-dependent methyltransferase [Deltaproteobacteria bacterium]
MARTLLAEEYKKVYAESIGSFEIQQVHRNALQYLNPTSGEKILDVGCGRGELVLLLQEAGSEAVGLDYLPEAIQLAQQNVPKAEFLTGDVTALPFPSQRFYKITALGVLSYLSELDLEKAFSEFSRVLKPGGMLLIRTTQPLNRVGTWILRLVRPGYRSKSNYCTKRFLTAALIKQGFTVNQIWTSLDEKPQIPTLKRALLKLLHPFFASMWIKATKQ